MTEREIIKKAAELRTKQKTYFRTRNNAHLEEAKNLEREFDKILQTYFSDDGQTSLIL